jgi:hypothetical protein
MGKANYRARDSETQETGVIAFRNRLEIAAGIIDELQPGRAFMDPLFETELDRSKTRVRQVGEGISIRREVGPACGPTLLAARCKAEL